MPREGRRPTPLEVGNFTHSTWRGQYEQVWRGAGRLEELVCAEDGAKPPE